MKFTKEEEKKVDLLFKNLMQEDQDADNVPSNLTEMVMHKWEVEQEKQKSKVQPLLNLKAKLSIGIAFSLFGILSFLKADISQVPYLSEFLGNFSFSFNLSSQTLTWVGILIVSCWVLLFSDRLMKKLIWKE